MTTKEFPTFKKGTVYKIKSVGESNDNWYSYGLFLYQEKKQPTFLWLDNGLILRLTWPLAWEFTEL